MIVCPRLVRGIEPRSAARCVNEEHETASDRFGIPADGSDRVRLEQEMGAALEATVSVRAVPEGRALTTADFTAAIDNALGSLRRIAGSAA